MSAMKNLVSMVQEDLEQDILSFARIAEKHGVPIDWVAQIASELRVELEKILDSYDDMCYNHKYSRTA